MGASETTLGSRGRVATASAETGLSPQARWLFVALALLAVSTILPEVRSANDASRMALTQALVEHRSLIIDQSIFVQWEDKSWVNGHFYSDKPALPSLLAAVVYWPIHALGIRLDFGVNFAYFLIVLLVSKTSWLGGAFAFYKGLRFVDVPESGRLGATIALAAGSLYLSYSAAFSNHGLAASWVAIGWYFYLRAVHTDAVRSSLAWAGLWLGLAGAADFPVLVYAAGVGALVLFDGRLRRGLVGYVVGVVVAMLPGTIVNYLVSGSVVPLTLVADYYLWPGSPWTRDELTGASRFTGGELVRYAIGCLVGPRGFLVYNPLLVPALAIAFGRLAGLAGTSGTRRPPFAREAAMVLACTAVLWGYYIASSTNYSGYSYSVRWFVPSLPLLLWFLAFAWRSWGRPWQVVFAVLFAASAVIALVGCLNPWSNLSVSQIPFTANLIEHWPQLGDLLPR